MQIRISNGKVVEANAGQNIYQALKESGIYLVASCGGKGVCGKCRVKVLGGRVRTESTGKLMKKEVDEHITLACTTFPEEDILIEIPEGSKLVIGDKIAISKTKNLRDFLHSVEAGLQPAIRRIYLELTPPSLDDPASDLERLKHALSEKGVGQMHFSHDFAARLARSLRELHWQFNLDYTEDFYAVAVSSAEQVDRYGIAIDIGTTTVVLYLVNYSDGAIVDLGMTYNSQMRYGDDVITRIVHATEGGGLEDLRSAVVNDMNDILSPMLEKHGIRREDVDSVVISGNTTMAHLFWGFDPSSIREEPYIPTLNTFPIWQAGTAGLDILPQAPVYTVPCVGSYVGGDIVAGVLASQMYLKPEIALFMDIGTNGEIVVGNNEWLMTAACSAGPCFEGSGIRHGMRATEGAIESVKVDPNTFEPTLGVIGNAVPAGICGSGMIDAISELFFKGVIDQRGKFMKDLKTDRIRTGDEGPEYLLHRGGLKEIVLTEVDIENVMRAKAAIYAGVSILLKEVGLDLDVVERIYIAGGFGNYLDIDKAIMIGMLPDMPKEKFSFIGNTSIAGAYLCLLSDRMRKEAEEIAKKMTYAELSVSRGFMDEYMSALFLPHTDMSLFPTVRDLYRKS
ncbi:MAG: ASKHA domain-containing protein [Nitrospiraceae bacterium]|nr:ASKHA domain-containing protein [Nitrospiraceae bacterium]